MHVSWEISDLLGRIFMCFLLTWLGEKKKQNISCEQDICATENPHGRTREAPGKMKCCRLESGGFLGKAFILTSVFALFELVTQELP